MKEEDKLSERLKERGSIASTDDMTTKIGIRLIVKELKNTEDKFDKRIEERGSIDSTDDMTTKIDISSIAKELNTTEAEFDKRTKERERDPRTCLTDYMVLTLCEDVFQNLPKRGSIGGYGVVALSNKMMTDYKGSLTKDVLLSIKDKPFMPQPGMLDYWACGKGFEVIKNNGEKLNKEDVAGKFVLTYYKPFADSWMERDTDDIVDLTNKHWYSHTKSTLYDKEGKPIKSSNAEAFYNDDEHDATVYVPHDSVSYAIDYKALGLDREDIEDGLFYQHVGMNVMDPNLQKVIFRLKECNLSRDDILSLWQDKVDFSNSRNIDAIVNVMKEGKGKAGIKDLNLVTTENNKYNYNIQDYSCAIQATAPVLYATSAKIRKEGFTQAQAYALRKHVGLYNIYDEVAYKDINKEFYEDYSKYVKGEVLYNFDKINDIVITSAKMNAKFLFLPPPIALVSNTADLTKLAIDKLDELGVSKKVEKELKKVKKALVSKVDKKDVRKVKKVLNDVSSFGKKGVRAVIRERDKIKECLFGRD